MMEKVSPYQVLIGSAFAHSSNPKIIFRVEKTAKGLPVIVKVGKPDIIYALIEKVTEKGFIASKSFFDKNVYNIILFTDLVKPT